MKKLISVILLIAITASMLIFSGCKDEKKQTLEIKLKANATTGYKWTYFADKKGVVSIKGKYVADEAKEGTVGSGGTQIFTIKGKKKGKLTVTFTYEAPGTREIALVAVYEISVDDDMNITEKSHSGNYFDEDNIEESKVYVIKLPCDGESGYKWKCKLDKGDLAKVTEDYRPNGYIRETQIVEEPEEEKEEKPKNDEDEEDGETEDEVDEEQEEEQEDEPETVTIIKDAGTGGIQIFAIESKKAGEIVLKFTYEKEGEEAPMYDAVYRLEIDSKLRIKEVSKSGSYFTKQ